jgi:hypothetical protein
MRIESMTAQSPVQVESLEHDVELAIGEPEDPSRRLTRLSAPQAEMLQHALGLAVARIREQDRLRGEEQARLAGSLLDQEFRRG